MSEGGDDSAQDIHQPSNRVVHFWQKYYSIFAEEYSNNIWKYLLIISYNTVDYPNNPLLFWAASIRQKIQSASGQKISLYKILHTQGNSHTHILHLTQAPDTHNQGEQTAFNQRQISHMDNKAFELWIWITNTPLRASDVRTWCPSTTWGPCWAGWPPAVRTPTPPCASPPSAPCTRCSTYSCATKVRPLPVRLAALPPSWERIL